MKTLRLMARYATFPLYALGLNGLLIWLVGQGLPWWQPFVVLLAAIVGMFGLERLIPYQPAWNRDDGDSARDVAHSVVNTASYHAGLLLMPFLASLALFEGAWPHAWPFALQVIGAIVVLDLGIAAAHHASHRWNWLWHFHAVHHSVKRLYGFNGLMKHPVHQAIEATSGVAPLLFLGIPTPVATALAFCVAIQLLLQHSNADYRLGPFKWIFAGAEIHRFHHTNVAERGNVNFGLFTNLWDHLSGTFHYVSGHAPTRSDEVGIGDAPDYPKGYLQQLLRPFRRQPTAQPETA